MPVYRFADAALRPERAHSGAGEVQAARVRARRDDSSINFIDLVIVPPGATIGTHRHAPSDEEIYVIVRGTATMLIDGRDQRVGPGDVVVNPRGGAHGLRNPGPESMALVVVDVATDRQQYRIPEDIAQEARA